MRLTSRILMRAGRPVEVLEGVGTPNSSRHNSLRLDWEEVVPLKRQLMDGWEDFSGEEILEQLEYIWTTQNAGVPRIDLNQNLDLWLLKALAQEKSLYSDADEIEETYHHCRHLGRWNSVIVRNNLAVLKARRLECLDSLKLLAEAIQIAVTHKVLLRAPFYNAALIFQQLHNSGLIFNPQYEQILDELAAAVDHGGGATQGEAASVAEQTTAPSGQADQATEQSDNLPDRLARPEGDPKDVRAKYVSLARYGHDLEQPEPRDIIQRSVAYLAPSLDLFESFGDYADKIDARNAQKHIEKGNELANKGKFAQSVESFKMAVLLDPARESEVSVRLAQLYDQWRYKINRRMSRLLEAKRFDDASRVISELPDENLRRPDDDALLASIRKQKHAHTIEVAREKGEAEARITYLSLLKEADLDDALRLTASGRLAERLNDIKDDAGRQREIRALVLHGLHRQVLARLTGEIERQLVKEALSHADLQQHVEAIRKYFWAMLLPGRTDGREKLFKAALAQFARLPESQRHVSSCQALDEEEFAELKAELKERWDKDRSAALVSEFDRLDAEPHLSRKHVDDLSALLEKLIDYEPTTERRLARLRLTREKQAQDGFRKIEALLGDIVKKGDQAERSRDIEAEVNTLRELAVDFAASEQRRYAEEINDFVLRTEELLRHADNQKFKHGRTFEVNRRNEKEFLRFREALGKSPEPTQTLRDISRQLRTARGGPFYDAVAELSLHWLNVEGKNAYYNLAAKEPANVALAAINESLAIIRGNHSVLPEEFKDGLRRFLEELSLEIEMPAQVEETTAPSAPPPPAPPEGLLRRLARWFTSRFS